MLKLPLLSTSNLHVHNTKEEFSHLKEKEKTA